MEVEALAYFFLKKKNKQGRRYRRHVTTEEEVSFWNEREFIARYRVDKETFHMLLPRWEECPWSNKTRRGYATEPGVQLLQGLRWYANGTVLRDVGDAYRFDKSTISRTVRKVSQFLVTLADEYIKMPTTSEELKTTADRFYALASFPGAIGAIDGTHVLLKPPKEEEDYYVDRHFNHSLSVQIICNRDLEILQIDPAWPGSTHDSYILRNGGVFRLFEEGRFGRYVLLGDSGYPCRRWLMTPYKDPEENTPESRFNTSQMVSRCCVERCIGVLKSRFRCLSRTTGELMNSPEEVTRIVIACAILHNICIKRGLEEPDVLAGEEYSSEEEDAVQSDDDEVEEGPRQKKNPKLMLGSEVRKDITKKHFRQKRRTYKSGKV